LKGHGRNTHYLQEIANKLRADHEITRAMRKTVWHMVDEKLRVLNAWNAIFGPNHFVSYSDNYNGLTPPLEEGMLLLGPRPKQYMHNVPQRGPVRPPPLPAAAEPAAAGPAAAVPAQAFPARG
jgi:hypothetical protein